MLRCGIRWQAGAWGNRLAHGAISGPRGDWTHATARGIGVARAWRSARRSKPERHRRIDATLTYGACRRRLLPALPQNVTSDAYRRPKVTIHGIRLPALLTPHINKLCYPHDLKALFLLRYSIPGIGTPYASLTGSATGLNYRQARPTTTYGGIMDYNKALRCATRAAAANNTAICLLHTGGPFSENWVIVRTAHKLLPELAASAKAIELVLPECVE
jgi:hypothetical protein